MLSGVKEKNTIFKSRKIFFCDKIYNTNLQLFKNEGKEWRG